MANIFANATRNVRANTCIKKTFSNEDKKTDAVGLHEMFTDIKLNEECKTMAESVTRRMANETKNANREATVLHSMTEQRIINATNKINEKCRAELFKDIIYEYFANALWLDESFVMDNSEKLYEMVSTYVDNNGGFNILKEAMEVNPSSNLLKKIYEACDKVSKKVTNRKLSEMTTSKDADEADTSLNNDEKNEYLDAKNGLDIERISELVKDKVLTVIQDEKTRQSKEDETISDIEDEIKKDDNAKDEDTVKEALNKIVINHAPYEEATLFNALLRNSYNEIMHENVAIQAAVNDEYREHRDEYYDVNQTLDEYDEEHKIDEFNNVHDANAEDNDEEINDDLAFENSATVNMDNVFADAIVNYTLMETLYTLKLENYTHENLKKLTQRIVNPVTESEASDSESEEFVAVRADFFKIFNKFKNLTDVDKTKEDLKKFVDGCGENEDKAHYCEIQLSVGIAQLKDIIEKNPNLKDKYQDIIDWCQEELM